MLKKIIWIPVVAALIIIIIVFIFAKNSVITILSKNRLLPEPERFTELYFENYLNLPKNIIINEPIKFSFTIHNLEYKTMNYQYDVNIEGSDGIHNSIAKESITLLHDQIKTIPMSFILLHMVKRVKVVVNLIKKHQEIHYWIGTEK